MDSFAEYDNAYLRGRMEERARCAEIARRWMRGWRTSHDIALAEIVAEGIAEEILDTNPDPTPPETSDE